MMVVMVAILAVLAESARSTLPAKAALAGLAVLGVVACAPSVTPSSTAAADPPATTRQRGTRPADTGSVGPADAPQVRPRLQSSGSGCIDGARTLATPNVCLKIPAGYEITGAHPNDLTLMHAAAPPIRLRWGQASASLLEDMRGGLEHLAEQDPEAVVGKTFDGRGVFVFASQSGLSKTGEAPEVRRALSVGRSAQGVVVRCSVEAAASDAVTRELFEACQTLSFPASPE